MECVSHHQTCLLVAALSRRLVELLSAAGCSAAKEGPERVKTNF